MIGTFEALGVVALALLPGALYTWAFERLVGAWGVGLSDRLLRFVGVSAIFHAVFLPVSYWVWTTYMMSRRIGSGTASPGLWALALLYVAIPIAAGTAVGSGTRSGSSWAKLFTGPEPAPRAWDHLFGSRPDGWIRLHLKTGTWIGGAFAQTEAGVRPYAAGYPESQDLYLSPAVLVDPDTGEFVLAEDGEVVALDSGILIRWEEVEYLEFIDA